MEQGRQALSTALVANPANTTALLIQARETAVQKDFDGSLVLIEAILARAPTDPRAWKLKGDVLLGGKKNAALAMESYRKSVEVKPDFIEGHVAIISQHVEQRRMDEANTQLLLLRKVAPANLQGVYFQTLLAFQKRQFKEARDSAQILLKMAPDSAASLELAASIEIETNSFVQAEAMLSKAMQLAPDAITPRRMLAGLYLRMGQPEKASAIAQAFSKRDDLDPESYVVLGQIQLQSGNAKLAEELFAKAEKLDPKSLKARTALALIQMVSGRDEVGLTALRDISAIDTGTTATLALISAHLSRREFDKALKGIDELEKKLPGKPVAAHLRGRTLLAKKDVAGARKSFERSLEIDPAYFASSASLA